jgi:hypothetical protein
LCNARQVGDIQKPTEVSLIRESKKGGEFNRNITEIFRSAYFVYLHAWEALMVTNLMSQQTNNFVGHYTGNEAATGM